METVLYLQEYELIKFQFVVEMDNFNYPQWITESDPSISVRNCKQLWILKYIKVLSLIFS